VCVCVRERERDKEVWKCTHTDSDCNRD